MGNDSRLSDARTPTSHTHTASQVTDLGTAATTNTGTGGDNTILGNDSRLSDSRTPTSHTHTLDGTTITGTLPVSKGGTGSTSYTAGGILYASDSTTLSELDVGVDTQVLTLSNGIPAWADSTGGNGSGSSIRRFNTEEGSTIAGQDFAEGDLVYIEEPVYTPHQLLLDFRANNTVSNFFITSLSGFAAGQLTSFDDRSQLVFSNDREA